MVNRPIVTVAGTKKGTPAISVLQQNGEDRHDVPVTGTTILLMFSYEEWCTVWCM